MLEDILTGGMESFDRDQFSSTSSSSNNSSSRSMTPLSDTSSTSYDAGVITDED